MTTVVLEGTAIEPLLARVASEHGPTARVVRAEKVRSGGVAGFFARERFELVVEVDDELEERDDRDERDDLDERGEGAPPAPSGAHAAPSPSVPQQPVPHRPVEETAMTAQHDHRPGTATDGVTGPVGGGARRDEVLDELFDSPIARALVRSQALDAEPDAAPAVGLDALLAAADAREAAAPHAPAAAEVPTQGERPGARAARGRHAGPAAPLDPAPGRPVSTESAAFAAVLDAVRDAAEPDHEPAHEPAPQPAPARAADLGAAPAPSVDVPAVDDVDPEPVGPAPVPAGQAVAELMALLTSRHGAPGSPAEPVAQPAAEPAAEPAPTAAAPAAPTSPAPARGTEEDPMHEQLAAAGMPERLLRALPAGAGSADVHALLAALPGPAPLPARDGDLVVVVGAPRDSLGVAHTVANRLGVGPQAVVVAARPGGTGAVRGDVVRDAVAARRAAATVRLGDAPGVVVVQADCDAEDVRWAADVVTALQADQVHVVVDATRKPRDTERWLAGVAVDGADVLHVVRAGGTSDPGTPLGFGLPVATVDGGPGGPGAWMSLLLPEPDAEAAPAPRRRRPAREVAW